MRKIEDSTQKASREDSKLRADTKRLGFKADCDRIRQLLKLIDSESEAASAIQVRCGPNIEGTLADKSANLRCDPAELPIDASSLLPKPERPVSEATDLFPRDLSLSSIPEQQRQVIIHQQIIGAHTSGRRTGSAAQEAAKIRLL